MMNKDVVIATIQESLLSAERLDKEQFDEFVKKRMCEPPESEHSIKALIHMNKAATFASLYAIVQDVQGKQNTIKVDKNIWIILHKAYDCL